jgi:colanic acid biosynthesis glycosyl transferase WcaI
VCAPPYYPEWRVASGYSALRYSTEERGGVALWRAPLWVPSRPSGMRRIAHLASFALSSFRSCCGRRVAARRRRVHRAEPAQCTGRLARRAPTGAHAWIHIQDYEVDAAFSLGMLKDRCSSVRCLRSNVRC